MLSFTFKKQERLCSRKEIDELFKNGRSFSNFPFRVIYEIQEEGIEDPFPARILISVPKRKIKKAVGRNRIKRLIKEAYRLNKNELIQSLKKENKSISFALIFNGLVTEDFNSIQQKIIVTLNRLCDKVTNPS